MNPWLAFLIGGAAGSALFGVLLGLLLRSAASSPEMALRSMASLLRGFERRVEGLSIVLEVEGKRTLVPFEMVTAAIESASLARHSCEGDASKLN